MASVPLVFNFYLEFYISIWPCGLKFEHMHQRWEKRIWLRFSSVCRKLIPKKRITIHNKVHRRGICPYPNCKKWPHVEVEKEDLSRLIKFMSNDGICNGIFAIIHACSFIQSLSFWLSSSTRGIWNLKLDQIKMNISLIRSWGEIRYSLRSFDSRSMALRKSTLASHLLVYPCLLTKCLAHFNMASNLWISGTFKIFPFYRLSFTG